jgi:hypothetical protein
VKHREPDNPRCLDAKEHRVREAAHANAPDVTVHEGEPRRTLRNRLDSTLYLRPKLRTEPGAPFLVPHRGIAKLALSRTTKDDLKVIA